MSARLGPGAAPRGAAAAPAMTSFLRGATHKSSGGTSADSVYQKTVIENVLQKPYTTLESYYDFWTHMQSPSNATYFFTSLAQKLLAADKKNSQACHTHLRSLGPLLATAWAWRRLLRSA